MAIRLHRILDCVPNETTFGFKLKRRHSDWASCRGRTSMPRNSGACGHRSPEWNAACGLRNRSYAFDFCSFRGVVPLKLWVHAQPTERMLYRQLNPAVCVGCFLHSKSKMPKKRSKKLQMVHRERNSFPYRSFNATEFALPASVSSLASSSNTSFNSPSKFGSINHYSMVQDDFYNSCDTFINSKQIEHRNLFDWGVFQDTFNLSEGKNINATQIAELLASTFISNIPVKVSLFESGLDCILSPDDCCLIIQSLARLNYKECLQEFMEVLNDWSLSETSFLKPVAVGMGMLSSVPQMHDFVIQLKSTNYDSCSNFISDLVCSALVAERYDEAFCILEHFMNDPVFCKQENPFLYKLALASCLKKRKYYQLSKILFERDQNFCTLDSISYALAISSCSLNEDETKAEALYKQFQEECLIPEINVLNSVLDIFARNQMEKAEKFYQLIESASSPNRFTFLTLLNAYAFHGDCRSVNRMMNTMTSSGIEADPDAWSIVLVMEGLFLGDLSKAKSTWIKLTKHPSLKNNNLLRTLYLLILRIHNSDDQTIFEIENEMNATGLCAGDVIVIVKQILFCDYDDCSEGWNDVKKYTDLYTRFLQILDILSENSSLMYHDRFLIEKRNIERKLYDGESEGVLNFDQTNVFLVNGSMGLLFDESNDLVRGNVNEVAIGNPGTHIIFNGSKSKLTSVGHGRVKRWFLNEGKNGLRRNKKKYMNERGENLNLGIREFAFRFYEYQRRKWIKRWSSVHGILEMYSYGKNYKHAMTVFKGMQSLGLFPDVHDYNAILSICKNRKSEKLAEKWFQNQKSNQILDQNSFNLLLKCYAKTCNYEKARSLFNEMKECGFPPTVDCLVTLSLAAARTRRNISKAYEIFQPLIQSSDVSDARVFNVAIEAYSRNKEFFTCKQIFNKLILKGIQPGYMIHSSMLIAACRCEQMNQAFHILRRMKSEGFNPSAQLYMHLVGLCVKQEKYDVCIHLFEEMIKDDAYFDLRAISELFLRYAQCMRQQLRPSLHQQLKESTPSILRAGILALENVESLHEDTKNSEIFKAMDQILKSNADLKDKKNVCLTLVTGLWDVGRFEPALAIFRAARIKGILPGILYQNKSRYEAFLTDIPHSIAATMLYVFLFDYLNICEDHDGVNPEDSIRFSVSIGGSSKRQKSTLSSKVSLRDRISEELAQWSSPLILREGKFMGMKTEICPWLNRIKPILLSRIGT